MTTWGATGLTASHRVLINAAKVLSLGWHLIVVLMHQLHLKGCLGFILKQFEACIIAREELNIISKAKAIRLKKRRITLIGVVHASVRLHSL